MSNLQIGLDCLKFWDDFMQGVGSFYVRRKWCPSSSAGVKFIVLVGRKWNLKPLDSQELRLRCVSAFQKSHCRPAGPQLHSGREVCGCVGVVCGCV